MLTLKGISRAAAIPQFAVDGAKLYSEGHQLESLENSLILKVITHIAERIGHKIVFSGVQISELQKTMFDLADEAVAKTRGLSVEFPRQRFWNEMVKVLPDEPLNSPKNELRIGIWAIQRNCYSGLFFANEDFLVRCVHTQSGKNTWASSREFNGLCRDSLGDKLAEACWLDSRIVNAKRIRHSLAHVGGRETNELNGTNHGIDVVDGRLQILPIDVLDLFNLVKPRIKSLVEWAIPLSAFG